ncbi:hypothetical protein IAR55_004809 [Kwoniella newhampshirensis]|uniref:Isochorismatase-like domain-containing protein n=1 Tax=Kwoniella newhampshirensis TaxID=1651941 RepID=A0AAW0YWB2_9TREE
MNTRNTILLVCDVQERFRSAIHGFDAMTAMICKMVKAAHILEISTMITEQNPRALGATVSEITSVLGSGSPHLTLGIHPKTKFSMVTDDTGDLLQKEQYETYIITGIESHVCVLQTALDLLRTQPQPNVFVLADAVSSCNKQEVPIALRRLERAGGIVTTTESLIFQLLGDAKDPNFKAIANLIKEEKNNTLRALEMVMDRT